MYAILIKLGLRTIYQIVTPLMSHLSLLKFWEVIWDDSLPLLLGGESLRPKFESKKRLVTQRLADQYMYAYMYPYI